MKYKHLFGPVSSRRLGISLGVDLVPYKYCPLNCVYCEVQRTTHLSTQRGEFFPTREIIEELDDFLKSAPKLDYITFSGAGEPTLHSGIGRIIDHVKDRYPQYKLALLTNGILLSDDEVRASILRCDLILPSLDGATQGVFEQINRPMPGLMVEDLISGLEALRREFKGEIRLEVFIIEGLNDTPNELEALVDAIGKMQPDIVQLNSLDRPGTEDWVRPASVAQLNMIKGYFDSRLDIPVEIIAKIHYASALSVADKDILAAIEALLIRRPGTAEDISAALGIHINEISKIMRELHQEGTVGVKREERGVFYTWTSKT